MSPSGLKLLLRVTSVGRHAIYIAGLSVFWGDLHYYSSIRGRIFRLQALVSKSGSDCMDNPIITLSALKSL
jgi:hypothetical protein